MIADLNNPILGSIIICVECCKSFVAGFEVEEFL
jgi:hypothetical protein